MEGFASRSRVLKISSPFPLDSPSTSSAVWRQMASAFLELPQLKMPQISPPESFHLVDKAVSNGETWDPKKVMAFRKPGSTGTVILNTF